MYYIYQADHLCEDCGQKTILALLASTDEKDRERLPEVDCRHCKHRWIPTPEEYQTARNHAEWFDCPNCGLRMASWDDYTFDTDDFPKGCPNEDSADSPAHCYQCHSLITDIGLTSHGTAYVLETLQTGCPNGVFREDQEVLESWADNFGFRFDSECPKCLSDAEDGKCPDCGRTIEGQWVSRW